MHQPEPLTRNTPWPWSPGRGTDVWATLLACRDGDVAALERLLHDDPSLVRAHYEYRTPLAFAVRNDRREVARLLLERGADPIALGNVVEDARDRGLDAMVRMLEEWLATRCNASLAGEPVAGAIRDRDRKAARRLLDADPALLHAGDRRSSQPIHWAVMTRQLPIIDDLLARGADIDARRQDGARPIHLTNGDYHYRGWRDVSKLVRTSPRKVFQHLVERGARVDLGMAAATGDIERVRALIDADPSSVDRLADYNSYYVGCGAPLKNAAVGGHLEIVKLLLDHGADPNLPEEGIAPSGHALYSAVYGGHHDIARLLLDHGAHADADVESSADAVSIAIMNGDLRMLRMLAERGATWKIPMRKGKGLRYEDIAATGVRLAPTVLAEHGDVTRAASIFERDPALANDPEALEHAARGGHEAFVRLMLRHQPDLARRVTVAKPRAMAELLFARGMDANRRSWLEVTPLHHLVSDGDAESVELFLAHGADVHAREDESDSTPLAWAAREGQLKMVELLLRRGARAVHPDDPPWATPLAWATRRGHDAIARLLTKHEHDGTVGARES